MLFCLLSEAAAFAVPAYPKPRKVVQPDGSSIELYAHGDEFFHYLTTADGTVVAKDADGFYRPTGKDAKNMAKARANSIQGLRRMQLTPQRVAGKKYHGLVILVNFNDCQFSRGNEEAHLFYNEVMNQKNFTLYHDPIEGDMKYTGSVRDYFNDNSYEQFDPTFDVVGPLDMDLSRYDMNGANNTYDITEKVLKEADKQVDFTQYDSDGDGVVDMVYIIYAGYGSNYQGNDERLVWPHAGNMIDAKKDIVLDGKRIKRFACSTELLGWEEDNLKNLDGIGVIVHEFSHVLGFQDHYDSSNGYQEHPNAWDVMAAGNYSDDNNRTPCAFNSYEKYSAGFSQPLNITQMSGKHITLSPYNTSEDACILRSYQDKVFFAMENRQKVKWDKYLPGHGLLVWRVDSTNSMYWDYNAVNVTTRACFRLVRACGTQGSFLTGVVDTDYDPFPGTHNITTLNNEPLAANLKSYDSYPCPVVLQNIAENDGVISFDVATDPLAENRPITYKLPDRLYASGEQLVGDEWKPIHWTITKKKLNDTEVLVNFLPNTAGIVDADKDFSDGVYVNFSYADDDAHSMYVEGQRVARGTDNSTWICDFDNADQHGSGTMFLTVTRYGIPSFTNSAAKVGYCLQKPNAYMISLSNMLKRIATFRNITFSEKENDATGIENIENKTSDYKQDHHIYNLNGQRVNAPIPGNIYISNQKKFISK